MELSELPTQQDDGNDEHGSSESDVGSRAESERGSGAESGPESVVLSEGGGEVEKAAAPAKTVREHPTDTAADSAGETAGQDVAGATAVIKTACV